MMYLTEPDLGTLSLHNPLALGNYVVSDFTIGAPTRREVVRNRALANGEVDDTRYIGSRIITVTIRLRDKDADAQLLADAVKAYMSPLRRPRLTWRIPRSTQLRSALVRGVDDPLPITSDRYPTLVATFRSQTGVLQAAEETVTRIQPSADSEAGRVYDLVFDRQYPASSGGIGGRILTNQGNAPADWRAVIFGDVTEPELQVNGIPIRFDQEGGLALGGGTSVVIDTREQTILLNGDPAESRYEFSNFVDWTWEQVRLQPGDNLFRYEGLTIGAASSVVISYRSSWQ